MSNNETQFTAAVARLFSLSSLGEIKTRINPDLTKEEKSTEIFLQIENFEFGVEVVNVPEEKLIFWVDGQSVLEETWAEVMDKLENDEYFRMIG